MPGILHASFSSEEFHAAPLYRTDLIGDPDVILRDRILGRWRADDFEVGDVQPVYTYDLEFNADGTFSYTRAWLNQPAPRHRTSVGTWTVSDGQLIQNWRRSSGRGTRTTVSTIVKTRPREIVIDNTFSRASSFYRQPRIAERM